jgi:hypothetical protein
MTIVRSGSLVHPRMVKLSCGHEQKSSLAAAGDIVGCLQCPQKKVFRSHLNNHTRAPRRRVVEVFREGFDFSEWRQSE